MSQNPPAPLDTQPFKTQLTVDVLVTGIGSISALGNAYESWHRLLDGESGLRLQQPFPEFPPRPLGTIATQPIEFLKLVDLVVNEALKDAGLISPLPDCGVVIGSSRSQQHRWEELHANFCRQSSSQPLDTSDWHWLDSLPHMGAIAAARKIGATGVVLAPMAACATGIWALARAYELIQTGECDRVIAGAVETPITPLTLAGFDKMGALAQTESRPFDRNREGLALGEGAAVFVLETSQLARRRHAKIYGRVLGFGLTADGHHVCATEPGGKSAIGAIRQCLDRSGLVAEDIDYIHAHGTSTPLNDRSEAQTIERLFPWGVPVSSTKGATGHTVGASGALGTAFCLMALQQGKLPPCVGLQDPEFDLDFVRVARPADVRRVLCFSFGFGGQNAAIALGSLP
ncbi:MAG: beta-ketoacyl-ACP synthase [Cyanobacteriota bacterium]|nr:beta-ketoacyl-ACP synthase [Cyanobacteriota bacterium]